MRGVRVVGVVVAVLGLSPTAATAGTARGVSSGGPEPVFAGAPGERNDVEIVFDGMAFTLTDRGAPVTAGAGCLPQVGGGVRCTQILRTCGGSVDCYAIARVDLGDADDRLVVRGDPGIVSLSVDGGAGRDLVQGAFSRTRDGQPASDGFAVDGGDGDDVVLGSSGADRLSGGSGADLLQGRGGFDSVSYADRGTAVRVSLDGVANDGAPGERDDVRVDSVTGSPLDDTLVGSDNADVLDGGGGRDTVDGRGGADGLTAYGAGSDVICGGGEDRAGLAALATADLSCELAGFDGTPTLAQAGLVSLSGTDPGAKAVSIDAPTARASRRGRVRITLRRGDDALPARTLAGTADLRTLAGAARSTPFAFGLARRTATSASLALDAATRRRLARNPTGITLVVVRVVEGEPAGTGPGRSRLRIADRIRVLPPRR